MLKNNYYYLVAGLPELSLDGINRDIGIAEFYQELKLQLNKSNYELAKLLYLDNYNKHFLNEHLKNTDFHEIESLELIEPMDYNLLLLELVEKNELNSSGLQVENKLHSLYYEYVLSTQNDFLRKWFWLELNIKNIFTAFNCKRYNHSLEKHLIKVDQNAVVYSLLVNKQLNAHLFEDVVPYTKEIFSIAESSLTPEEKEKQTDEILWNYAEELSCYHYFTIEIVLCFIIKLMIKERWTKLDSESGKICLNNLLKQIKISCEFSKEFAH